SLIKVNPRGSFEIPFCLLTYVPEPCLTSKIFLETNERTASLRVLLPTSNCFANSYSFGNLSPDFISFSFKNKINESAVFSTNGLVINFPPLQSHLMYFHYIVYSFNIEQFSSKTPHLK